MANMEKSIALLFKGKKIKEDLDTLTPKERLAFLLEVYKVENGKEEKRGRPNKPLNPEQKKDKAFDKLFNNKK